MALLGVVIALRSVAWFTLLAFVPLWVVSLGHSKADGNRLLFLMLLAGAVGTLLLGPVADRIGLRRTLVITQALLSPLILVFVYVGGVPGVLALMLVGVCVVGTFGVTMVLSQLYLPRHVGMASGLSVGLAMGIGGVAAVVLGAVADAVDLKTALTISALAPALGVVVLPAGCPRRRRRAEREAPGRRAPDRLTRRVGNVDPVAPVGKLLKLALAAKVAADNLSTEDREQRRSRACNRRATGSGRRRRSQTRSR